MKQITLAVIDFKQDFPIKRLKRIKCGTVSGSHTDVPENKNQIIVVESNRMRKNFITNRSDSSLDAVKDRIYARGIFK